jgi:hypothetical protein
MLIKKLFSTMLNWKILLASAVFTVLLITVLLRKTTSDVLVRELEISMDHYREPTVIMQIEGHSSISKAYQRVIRRKNLEVINLPGHKNIDDFVLDQVRLLLHC